MHDLKDILTSKLAKRSFQKPSISDASSGYVDSFYLLPTLYFNHHLGCINIFGGKKKTIEAFFREKPDRVISYHAIEEMAYLLGVKVSKKDQRNLFEKYKGKHKECWKSRKLIQRVLEDFYVELENQHALKK